MLLLLLLFLLFLLFLLVLVLVLLLVLRLLLVDVEDGEEKGGARGINRQFGVLLSNGPDSFELGLMEGGAVLPLLYGGGTAWKEKELLRKLRCRPAALDSKRAGP